MSLENLPVTPEEVCSRAAVLVGLEPITSFNDTDRDEVVAAATLYETVVANCLTAYPWRFASGEMILERATDDPLDRYENAWHYPQLDNGRALQLEMICQNDLPIRYDIVKNLIYSSADGDTDTVAHYQYRVEEAYWLPQFTLYVIYEMAATFADSITRNAKQISAFQQKAEVQFRRAKTRDAQSKTPKRTRNTGLRRRYGRLPGNYAV